MVRTGKSIRRNVRVSLVAVVLMVAISACASGAGPRQGERGSSGSLQPTVTSPGQRYIVASGGVTEKFVLDGAIVASDPTQYEAMYQGQISQAPPFAGDAVIEGDILYALDPSPEVRAVATELEAATFALRSGHGPRDERQERYDAAVERAIALGIPVDDPSALPLPTTIEVIADEDTTILGRYVSQGARVRGGQLVLEIGDTDDVYVEAPVTREFGDLLGFGAEVTFQSSSESAEVAAVEATIQRLVFSDDGTQSVELIVESEVVAVGDAVVIKRDTDPVIVATGVVEELGDEEDAPGLVTVLLDEPFFELNNDVTVVSRSDSTVETRGTISAIEVGAGGYASLRVDVPDGVFDFAEKVSVVIDGESRDSILWLPPEAIRTYAGGIYVIVEGPDGRIRVEVESGLVTETQVEIIGLIEEGDVVIGS